MYLMTQNLNLEELQTFLSWLDEKLREKGWTDNQLAIHAGITHPVISKARSGIQPVGYEAGVKIAKALDIPPALFLEKAGLLPPTSEMNKNEKELVFLFQQLHPDRQKEFIKMIRVLLPEDKK